MARVFYFFLILSVLSPHLCFALSAKKIFKQAPAGRPLAYSNQFMVVDDFNVGEFKERKGATWQKKLPQPDALELTLDKNDARNTKRGYSMRADFYLLAQEEASYRSFLERMDVSQAEALVFKARLKIKSGNLSGRIRLALSDWQHRKVVRDITQYFTEDKKGWIEIAIPISNFRSLDLDQLFSMSFLIVSRKEKFVGSLWIDEVAFFGRQNVSFLSDRDNIKGFPQKEIAAKRRQALLEMKDKEMLRAIAEDTWKFFKNARDKKTHLVIDHIKVGENPLAAGYTSLTNISMDLMGTVAAMDLGFISEDEARQSVQKVFKSLSEMARYKGFFYNFYDTKKLAVTRSYVSSVDSGWLAIAFVIIRQAFPGELADQATRFMDSFSFEHLLDPETNQLVIGIEVPEKDFGGYHYGMLMSEARATSIYAIGKGDLPRSHWWFLYRTPPARWDWQSQKPKGKLVTREGVDYFQGHYDFLGKNIVPSWGGSLFEYLMPTLVLKERQLSPKGFALNNRTAVELQRDYALNEMGYPVWGISPSSSLNGKKWKYVELGVSGMAVQGYQDQGVITPHVSFLALDSHPEAAIGNVRKLLEYEMVGEYGLYDSMDVKSGKITPMYLSLDQGMSLIAICNYLKKGSIQERFHKDSIGEAAQDLLKEAFFEAP